MRVHGSVENEEDQGSSAKRVKVGLNVGKDVKRKDVRREVETTQGNTPACKVVVAKKDEEEE